MSLPRFSTRRSQEPPTPATSPTHTAGRGQAHAGVSGAPSRTALIVAFTTIYLVWGSTYLGIRVAVETMPPFLMAGVRFMLAGGLLFTFLKLKGRPWPSARQWRINTIIGTFLLLGGNGLVVWAEQFTPSGITALIIGVTPLFIVLTEWAWPRGTRPGAITVAALLLGFAGVAWLSAPWERGAGQPVSTAGLLAILAACASWGVGAIFSRHAKHGAEPLVASALQMVGGGAMLFLASLIRGEAGHVVLGAISPASWFGFAYLVVVGSLVGFSTFVWLMKHASPARVATYAYVNPVVAVILGWLMLGEPITSRTVIGSAIIVTSVAIITTQGGKRKQS